MMDEMIFGMASSSLGMASIRALARASMISSAALASSGRALMMASTSSGMISLAACTSVGRASMMASARVLMMSGAISAMPLIRSLMMSRISGRGVLIESEICWTPALIFSPPPSTPATRSLIPSMMSLSPGRNWLTIVFLTPSMVLFILLRLSSKEADALTASSDMIMP